MAIADDYKELEGMIKSMESDIKTLSDLADSDIIGVYELNPSIKDVLMGMSQEELQAIAEESQIDEILKQGNCDIDSYKSIWSSMNDEPGDDFVKSTKEMFLSYKDSASQIKELEDEKNKITDELKQVTENWFEYVNSAEYKQKKLDKLNELREKAESEADPLAKKKILEMISSMESGQTLQFLFDRMEKNPEIETRAIKDSYFDSAKSQLIIKKFKSRLPRYNYNEDIYKMFFNIEEKFLPEEYHDFNNIFLFHVMRFISHTDTYNKRDSLYVSSILMKLYNLLYHKFGDDDTEIEFLGVIKRFDDYFKPYQDEFKEKNITSPNHPVRKKRMEEQEEKLRVMIIASLQNEGIEPDTALSTEELRAQLKEVIDKKSKDAEESQAKIEEESAKADEVVEEPVETRYYDIYNGFYQEIEDGVFGYFAEDDNRVGDDTFTEEDILRLMSTDSVRKNVKFPQITDTKKDFT